MHTTRAMPSEQDLRATLNSTGVFNLITDDRFLGTIETHLPIHRERTYPPSETLAMFVAQVLSDDSSCQRAVNERIVRCLQHGLRPPSTSTAAYCEARARLPNDLVESLYKVVGQHVSDSAPRKSLWRERRALFIDATIGPAKGKATGELSQMRILSRSLRPNDVLVGDAIYETFWTFMMVQDIGCDGVFEINGSPHSLRQASHAAGTGASSAA